MDYASKSKTKTIVEAPDLSDKVAKFGRIQELKDTIKNAKAELKELEG